MRRALPSDLASTFRSKLMPSWIMFTGCTMFSLKAIPDQIGVPAINEIFAAVYGEDAIKDPIGPDTLIYKNVSL